MYRQYESAPNFWKKKIFVFVIVLFFLTSVRAQPEDSHLPQFKAALELQNQGKLSEAEIKWTEILKAQNSLREYAHYYLAENLFRQNKASEAKIHLEGILQLSPNIKMKQEVSARLASLAINEVQFQRAKELLRPLEKGLRRDELYPEIIYLLGRAERGLGNQTQACRWFKILFSKFPSHSLISHWGPNLYDNTISNIPVQCAAKFEDQKFRLKNLLWAGQTEKASVELKLLKTVYARSKQETDALTATFLLQEGEVDQALDLLLSNYELRKSDPDFLSALAVAAARAGEVQLAVGTYYRIFKLSPRGKKGKEALYQSAFLSYQFQDYDGASRRFREFIKYFSSSALTADARWHLAWIRYLRGDFERAVTAFEDLLSQSFRGRRARHSVSKDRVTYWMAMSYMRSGNQERAYSLFDQLSRDKSMGFYAIASYFRMNQLRKKNPHLDKLPFVDRGQGLARFDVNEISGVQEKDSADSEEAIAQSNSGPDVQEGSGDNSSDADSADSGSDSGPEAKSNKDLATMEQDNSELMGSSNNPLIVARFERARDLMIIGQKDWAKWDLYDIERKTSHRDYLLALMREYESIRNFNRSSFIAQTSFFNELTTHGIEGARYLWEHAYPRAFKEYVNGTSKQIDLESELIWGIMRQESQFKSDVISPVGAVGLMQVMPMTGWKIARSADVSEFSSKMLFDPNVSIRLGGAYLKRIMTVFNGNIALTAAGYNAGPHRVKAWLNAFGNLDADEFIDHIPFIETRNYVKKVISNFQIYSILYNGKKERLAFLSEPLNFNFRDSVTHKEIWE